MHMPLYIQICYSTHAPVHVNACARFLNFVNSKTNSARRANVAPERLIQFAVFVVIITSDVPDYFVAHCTPEVPCLYQRTRCSLEHGFKRACLRRRGRSQHNQPDPSAHALACIALKNWVCTIWYIVLRGLQNSCTNAPDSRYGKLW